MKPMLAATLTDLGDLQYPLIASPKLDGIRALVLDGVVVSRNLKPIPNRLVQARYGRRKYNHFDGELVAGPATDGGVFRRTTSAVMSAGGSAQVDYHVFDCIKRGGYETRLAAFYTLHGAGISVVESVRILDEVSLLNYEARCLRLGYEGVMLRNPQAAYKHGRSTLREGALIKLKRFSDGEAVVLSVVEQCRNRNTATTDALGRAKRSSHKAGKQPAGVLGALYVRDVITGQQFSVGAGFTQHERAVLWTRDLVGLVIKYKHFPFGAKDSPRFPTFIGFRAPIEIGD